MLVDLTRILCWEIQKLSWEKRTWTTQLASKKFNTTKKRLWTKVPAPTILTNMIWLVLLKWQSMWLNLTWNKWTNFSEIINILRPLDYMSSIKTYFRFTMSKRTTRSRATLRDPKEHMTELYEEQSKGEWCTSAVPCFDSDSIGEIDLSRPCRIKTGVHSIDSSVPGIASVDEAKVTLHYDVRRGRIVQDRAFEGTQWIEFVSPFDEALGFRKKSDVHKLGNEVLLGLTGYSFRTFHQDIKPPQSEVCTVFGGRKLWLFRAPESRDAEWVGRVASSLTLSDVQQLMKGRRKWFFYVIRYEISKASNLYVPVKKWRSLRLIKNEAILSRTIQRTRSAFRETA